MALHSILRRLFLILHVSIYSNALVVNPFNIRSDVDGRTISNYRKASIRTPITPTGNGSGISLSTLRYNMPPKLSAMKTSKTSVHSATFSRLGRIGSLVNERIRNPLLRGNHKRSHDPTTSPTGQKNKLLMGSSSVVATTSELVVTTLGGNSSPLVRIIRNIVVAFFISEALAYAGFFGEANSDDIMMKQYEYRTTVYGMKNKAIAWWKEARAPNGTLDPDVWKEKLARKWEDKGGKFGVLLHQFLIRYRSFPDKTKFAIGSAVGLTSCRLIICSFLIGSLSIGLPYALLQLLHSLDIIGDAAEYVDGSMAHRLARFSEGTLAFIKNRIQPGVLMDNFADFSDGERVLFSAFVVGSIIGFLV